ncbi:hypothetical protein GCM10027048_39820 [Hymenobacter coalescens]
MISFYPTSRPAGGFLVAAALLLSLTSQAQTTAPETTAAPLNTRYRATALSLSTGWGAPYGVGLELSHFVTRQLDLNAGVGIGLSGSKLGLGARYFLAPNKRVSSYFGLNLVRSGGWNEVEMREGGGDDWYEDGYRIGTLTVKASTVAHLRYGVRWQPGKRPGRVGVLGTVGYGIRLGGDPMVYHMDPSFDKPDKLEQAVYRSVYAPGGLEFSLGLSLGLGERMRE